MLQGAASTAPLKTLCILGAGSWGTALAIALSGRFETISLWVHNAGNASVMKATRQNERYLPGFTIPPNVRISADGELCLAEAEFVISVVPSAFFRSTMSKLRCRIPPSAKFVSATKGIEEGSLLRMSAVARDVLEWDDDRAISVISGPTFAREVAERQPAAMVVASEDLAFAEDVQRALATPDLRFYATPDVVGVETGAALKNVVAIGAGICHGLGLGSNSVAALITRGLAEITRLAVRLGGNAQTLSGLAGLGDLVLTATGDLSRNRSVGIQLGRGERLDSILAGMNMVAEGVGTCAAAFELSRRLDMDLPIINKMHEILFEGKEPRMALRELMDRPLKIEAVRL
ncbi:MAG: NAD(P)H-dependent glycerol-3-phosphate dehydrogenase [Bryobacteraceae bacterium]